MEIFGSNRSRSFSFVWGPELQQEKRRQLSQAKVQYFNFIFWPKKYQLKILLNEILKCSVS